MEVRDMDRERMEERKRGQRLEGGQQLEKLLFHTGIRLTFEDKHQAIRNYTMKSSSSILGIHSMNLEDKHAMFVQSSLNN
jgi:hypothetical protein